MLITIAFNLVATTTLYCYSSAPAVEYPRQHQQLGTKPLHCREVLIEAKTTLSMRQDFHNRKLIRSVGS